MSIDNRPALGQAAALGPLAPLAEWPQFIVAKLVPKASGGTDKIPCNWITGEPRNAHDPANWTTYANAAAMAVVLGAAYRVGFVLTAADPWVCVDLDHVLQADEGADLELGLTLPRLAGGIAALVQGCAQAGAAALQPDNRHRLGSGVL